MLDRLALASEASALNLTQCAATAHECDRTSHTYSGEDLEQVPGCVVEEENALEGDKRSKEDGVGERCRLEGGGKMVDIGTEEEPLKDISIAPNRLYQQKNLPVHPGSAAQHQPGPRMRV